MNYQILTDKDVESIIEKNFINCDYFGMIKDAERLTVRRLTGSALNTLTALTISAALIVGALAYFDILTK
jgi:hypothetical protein